MPPVSDHLDCKQVKATRATSPRTIAALHLLREQPELTDQEIGNPVGVAVDGGACGRVWADEQTRRMPLPKFFLEPCTAVVQRRPLTP